MSFRLIKDIVANKLGFSQKPAARGPYGLSLGRLAEIEITPFILAEGLVDVASPGPQNLVVAHGVFVVGGVICHRYYLAERKGMLQVAENQECRFFRPLDEVYPASSQEWAFWLDDADGYIGYPVFEAKGKSYQRVWSPGQTRTAPLVFEEALEQADGSRSSEKHSAMLYARATGGQDEAGWEYLLVSAIEGNDGSAWVDLSLGMDVSPEMVKGI
ncbi:putative DUF2491 domain-containing protein [uncultured Gammaproteobacteria bacterium]